MKKIQILGSGCSKCKQLAANAEQAAKELGIEYEIEKVENVQDLMAYGVMSTPAIAVDGEVRRAGKVLEPEDLKSLIQ